MDDLADGEREARRVAVEFTIACGFRERGDGFRGLGVHERGFDIRAAEVDADSEIHGWVGRKREKRGKRDGTMKESAGNFFTSFLSFGYPI